jgi:hypothetical protein
VCPTVSHACIAVWWQHATNSDAQSVIQAFSPDTERSLSPSCTLSAAESLVVGAVAAALVATRHVAGLRLLHVPTCAWPEGR